MISIKPQMIRTNERLRSFEPLDRNCYFQGEKDLLYFKNYNQKNCEYECIVNTTLEMCGCVGFYMPSKYCNGKSIEGPPLHLHYF